MSLQVEILQPNGEWRQVGLIAPSDQPGSMSHNDARIGRHLILFASLPDRSVISRAGLGLDTLVNGGRDRAMSESATPDTAIAVLTKPDESTTLEVKTDAGSRFTVRFTHKPELKQ